MNTKFIYLLVLLACPLIGMAESGGTKGNSEPPTIKQETSNTNKDTPDRVGALNEKQINQLALSKEVKPKEITWLDVNYSREEGVSKVLALTEKPKLPDAQGAVLLLHDKGQHADWPYLIRPLRQYLPDSGWFTLSLSLPYESKRNVPDRSLLGKNNDNATLTDALRLKLQYNSSAKTALANKPIDNTEQIKAEQKSETASVDEETKSETPVDINLAEKQKVKSTLTDEAKAEFNIQAALDYIHQQGYQNIIIVTYGSAANLALNHIKEIASQISSKGFALVMVDPILKAEYQNDLESAFGKGFKAPILDIFNSADLDSKAQATERKSSAVVAKTEQYMQLNLITNNAATSQLGLLRRIRFWIERYAPGMSATELK